MFQKLTGSSEEAMILSALCRTDLTAWCFIRKSLGGVSCCSRTFQQLWKVESGNGSGNSPGFESENFFAEALAAQGIDARQFFSLVAEKASPGSPPILLMRKDGVKIHASVSPVKLAGVTIGYLVRFRELIEHNVIDAVLCEIAEAQRRLNLLSPREREVLRGIYDGRTNKAISISADISEKTVEKHRSRIMQKLELNNSAELFRLASRAMLLSDLQVSNTSG